VGDGRRRDADAAVEVGEEELGARLGAVDADDAEVFGPDLLDAWMQHAARLAEDGRRSAARAVPTATGSSHETCLR
jgi:hypothetical protein